MSEAFPALHTLIKLCYTQTHTHTHTTQFWSKSLTFISHPLIGCDPQWDEMATEKVSRVQADVKKDIYCKTFLVNINKLEVSLISLRIKYCTAVKKDDPDLQTDSLRSHHSIAWSRHAVREHWGFLFSGMFFFFTWLMVPWVCTLHPFVKLNTFLYLHNL